MKRALPFIFVMLLSSAASATDTTDPAVAGRVTVARADVNALLLWDATDQVASIVHSKMGDQNANARLEHQALAILIANSSKVPSAKTVTVRILYTMSGAVSPTYGSATFEGVERYATLAVPMSDLRSARDSGSETAPLPSWAEYKVTGTLPPR